MTDAIQGFPLAIPANGSPSNVFFTDCELGWSNVTQIVLVFPPGCAGQVGVRVEHGGAQLYPLIAGTWFIFDDYTLVIPVTGQGESGQWHVAGYNQDAFPHTVQAYFYYDYVGSSAQTATSPLVSL